MNKRAWFSAVFFATVFVFTFILNPLVTNAASPALVSSPSFTRDLKLGMSGEDVRALQIYLNTNGFPIAQSGIGSKGNESTYFGKLTQIALIKFQENNRGAILAPLGLQNGTGNFRAATRDFITNTKSGSATGGTGNSGSGSKTSPSVPTAVSVNVGSADLYSNTNLWVTANVAGATNTAVTWSVDNIPGGNATVGIVTGSGNTATYTAPDTTSSHTLVATSVQDPLKSATTNIKVTGSTSNYKIASLLISPATATVNTGTQTQFSAFSSSLSGGTTSSTRVSWSALRGKISSTGLYTAPSTSGADTVTARSTQNTSKTASASVTVNAPVPTITSVAVSPVTMNIYTGVQTQFTATVSGTGSFSNGVTWTALRGTVSSGGLYTAPSIAGADTVTVTSTQDTTKRATASISVNAIASTITSVVVSPATATVNTGAQTQFTATVSGTGSFSNGVTWTATGGTVSSAGLYTAPTTAGTYTVTAKSTQDTTKTASATVTVVIPNTVTGVVISPTTTTVNTGAQTQFSAAISGTGSFSSGVTWSALYGTVSSTGLYTAPASALTDTVTARSTQDTTKLGTASVTVSAIAPTITSVVVSPATATVNTGAQTQFTATVSGTGSFSNGVTWTATGGTVSSAGLYTAPTTAGTYTVTAKSTQDATKLGTANVTVTAPVTPPSGGPVVQSVTLDLPTLMSNYLSTYDASIETETLTGNVQQYASTSYYLNGLISAVEGTDNEQWLIKDLHYINNMLGKASDLNSDGLKEWGPLDANNRPAQADHFVTAVPLARTAAYIRNSPLYRTKYAADATNIYNFIDANIMQYWFNKTTGVYKVTSPSTWAWAAGQIPWLTVAQGGWQTTTNVITDTKPINMASTATAMYQAGNDPFYQDLATRTGSWFKSRLENYGLGDIWENHFTLAQWQQYDARQGAPFPDTSHSGRAPFMASLLYDAGLVFTKDDLTRLSRTLTENIWLQASPMMFANYISGDNSDYLTSPATGPGSIGNVYAGWSMLAGYDTRANDAMRMTLQGMINGQTIGQNNTSYGKIGLTGALIRAAKLLAPVVAPTITSVVVSPATATANTGAQTQFTATVSGTGSFSNGVTWTATGGTISSTGLYTAPTTAGTYTVTAKSTQDATKLGTATMTVNTATAASKVLVVMTPNPLSPMDLYNNLSQIKTTAFDGALVSPMAVPEIFVMQLYSAAAVAPNWTAGSARTLDQTYYPLLKQAGSTNHFIELRGGLQSGFDWFNDSQWNTYVVPNLTYVATLAAQNGLLGIVYDPEAYSSRITGFNYPSQTQYSTKTFAQYEAQLRARGKSFAQTIVAAYAAVPGAPKPVIMTLGGNSFAAKTLYGLDAGTLANTPAAIQTSLQGETIYGLLPSFVNGLIDGSAGNVVVDGNELSYYKYTAPEFQQDTNRIKTSGQAIANAVDTTLTSIAAGLQAASLYAAQLSVGFATYPDGLNALTLKPVVGVTTAQEHLNQIESNIYQSLTYANRFAWVFTEAWDPVHNTFKGTNCATNDAAAASANLTCSGINNAILTGKQLWSTNSPLGFDAATFH